MAAETWPVRKDTRSYQGRSAGFVTRTVACLVDGIVVLVAVLALYATVAGIMLVLDPRNFTLPPGGPIVNVTTATAVTVLYLGLSWWLNGRTYGGRLMGVRVQDRNGRRLRVGTAVLRALLCVAFPAGLLWVAFSRENRSLQDLVLRTSVVYDWQG